MRVTAFVMNEVGKRIELTEASCSRRKRSVGRHASSARIPRTLC